MFLLFSINSVLAFITEVGYNMIKNNNLNTIVDRYMSKKRLFEITEAHLNTGLRGFPVGKVRTSRVDKMTGVSYVGRPIGELAEDPEEVIYLLLNKRSPTEEELQFLLKKTWLLDLTLIHVYSR